MPTPIPPSRILYTSPDDDTVAAYLTWLSSQTFIRIADFSFNLVALTDLLISRHQSGADISLVLDKSQASGSTEIPQIARLRVSGIPLVLGTSRKHRIMHDKFTLGTSSTQYGSWNYTQAAALEDNFFFIDSDPLIYSSFLTTWNHMYDWIAANIPQVSSPK